MPAHGGGSSQRYSYASSHPFASLVPVCRVDFHTLEHDDRSQLGSVHTPANRLISAAQTFFDTWGTRRQGGRHDPALWDAAIQKSELPTHAFAHHPYLQAWAAQCLPSSTSSLA